MGKLCIEVRGGTGGRVWQGCCCLPPGGDLTARSPLPPRAPPRQVDDKSKLSFISEELCIGCGICVKKCPFEAISIINLPRDLSSETTHRYGPNAFKLHRLPMPRPGEVLGLVGTNGIGKSTALKVLSGKLKPNLVRSPHERRRARRRRHARAAHPPRRRMGIGVA
jgi:ferredoxin